MKNIPSLESLTPQLLTVANKLKRHSIILFVLLLGAIYGFTLNKINIFSNVQPTNAQVKALATPRIDPSVVSQLQNLKDNSVNVQALFNQARNNPFQE